MTAQSEYSPDELVHLTGHQTSLPVKKSKVRCKVKEDLLVEWGPGIKQLDHIFGALQIVSFAFDVHQNVNA